MGNWWSKITASSLDVTGNHNRVSIINDVQYDWSPLLNQLKQFIARENQTTTIVLVTGLIFILLVTIAFHLLKIHRQEQCRLTIAHLQSDIESLNRNIRMHSAPSNSRYNDVNSRRCFATLQIASIHTI